MRQLATVIPVSTDTFHLPTLASRPKNILRSEAAKRTHLLLNLARLFYTLLLYLIVPLSNELLLMQALVQGSIVSMIVGLMGTALAEEEDKAFWTGNGSGKPTGIDNYTFTTLTANATDVSRADT